MNFISRIVRFFARLNPKLSDVHVYLENHDTRFMTTAAMDAPARKKFLKYMFNKYHIKFIGIDGEVYYPKPNDKRVRR